MHALPRIPDELGLAFSLGQAASAGLTERVLLRAEVTTPFRGVRMRMLAAAEDEHPAAIWRRDILRLADACRIRMPPHAFFSHRTAAVIWGLPVRPGGSLDLDVSVFHPSRSLRSAGIRGRALRPTHVHVVRHAGFRLASAVSTWATLAEGSDVAELVAIGDAIARVPRRPGGFGPPAGPPIGTIDQMSAAIEAGRRVGVARLRDALPLIRTGSMSRPETEVRLALVGAGLPEPVLDVDVLDEFGAFLGCSELAYPRYRIALEYEGDHHRVSRAQWDRDIDKQQLYAEAGWRMIRITSRLAGSELIRRTRSALTERGWVGGG